MRCHKPAGAFYLFVTSATCCRPAGSRRQRVRAGAARRGARRGDARRGVRRARLRPSVVRDVDGERCARAAGGCSSSSARTRRARRSRDDGAIRRRIRESVVLSHEQGRGGDRRVEQPAEVRQPAVRAFVQAGLHGHSDQPARGRGRRAEEPTRRCSTSRADRHGFLYVPPEIGEQVIDEIAQKQIPEVWLNPGAESDALIARARALHIRPIVACSIVVHRSESLRNS